MNINPHSDRIPEPRLVSSEPGFRHFKRRRTLTRLYLTQRDSRYATAGPRRWFHVMIHDSQSELQAAAERYGRPVGEGCLGCCHPAPMTERYVDVEWVRSNPTSWAGVIRLCQPHITTPIVAHEMAHAALAIYRMDVCADVRLGNGCGDREETLAHITGDLIGGVSTVLHDAGIW